MENFCGMKKQYIAPQTLEHQMETMGILMSSPFDPGSFPAPIVIP